MATILSAMTVGTDTECAFEKSKFLHLLFNIFCLINRQSSNLFELFLPVKVFFLEKLELLFLESPYKIDNNLFK